MMSVEKRQSVASLLKITGIHGRDPTIKLVLLDEGMIRIGTPHGKPSC
jgi:hypothetical protein